MTTPNPRAASMTTDDLVELFAAWRKENGFENFEGDADDLQAVETLNDNQRSWLIFFCAAWLFAVKYEDAERGIEVACFELGPDDLRLFVQIKQNRPNLFSVLSWSQCDGEKDDRKVEQFANAALAFRRAFEMAQDEAADICDTVEG